MFTVIAGFIASEVLLMKQIGLGVGLAVLIDASVIRLFYLPSFMALMGEWNWVHPPSQIKLLIDKFGCSH
jgi:RND superfamily putative drug exporter